MASSPTSRRKLAAILMADVVAYGRHMAEDEGATVSALRVHRGVFRERIERRQGRVVDAKGDAIMAEFGSVVDAVASAVEIQRDIGAHNAPLDERRRMQFRVGINLGDVVEAEDAPYGDGVNIAARLETLAEPGGICISRAAYDQIAGKLPLEFEYLGEQRVKTQTIRAYRVIVPEKAELPAAGADLPKPRSSPASLFAASAAVILLALGSAGAWMLWSLGGPPPTAISGVRSEGFVGPSIAVLPFTNMSGDSEHGYFADGLTEDIITDLSQLRDLAVIARNSVFRYKGQPIDVREVGRDLGVAYVLEGSVRSAGERLRITAQLVDARTADHLWAERYDRPAADIFELQDEITRKIVTELEVEVNEGEGARIWRRGTDSLDAYHDSVRAHEAFNRFTAEDNAEAKRLLAQALEIDPRFAVAQVLLGWAHWTDAAFGFGGDPQRSMALAWEAAERAMELDPQLADSHSLFGGLHLLRGEFDRAVEYGRRAVELSPNGAKSRALYGWYLSSADRYDEALSQLLTAQRLNPNPPGWYLTTIAETYILRGEYQAAIASAERALATEPASMGALVLLVVAHSEAGDMEQAKAAAARIRELDPTFSGGEFVRAVHAHKNPAVTERHVRRVTEAGL